MKTLLPFASTLALSALLLTAQAQTPATSHDNPTPAKPTTSTKTADHRAAAYKGPKVVKDSKALGQKMVHNSKPTDTLVPVPQAKVK
jgi:hypothetical protein